MSVIIQKRYDYHVYRHGVYLGLLPNVKSDFTYQQLINTAGAQMTIEISQSPDTADTPVSPILDELGAIITDEVGGSLLEERAPDLVGDAADNILIRNDNDVKVYEVSDRHPNGLLVFQGYISKWKATFGAPDTITATVLSHGQDLSHYLTPGGTADTLDQSETSGTTDALSQWESGSSSRRYGQSWTSGASATNLSKIILRIFTTPSQVVTIKVWSSASAYGGTPLGTATATVPASTDGEITFTFATPITISANTPYFFSVHADPAVAISSDPNTWLSLYTRDDGTDHYAGGSQYRQLNGGAFTIPFSGYDLYFKTYYTVASTSKTYSLSDPSTTLSALMDYYISAGGSIAKQAGGYSLTGVTPANTTFKVNSILEAILQLITLAPSDWYWYVDPAADTLNFKQAATTAHHKMIRGRHTQSLSIEATKENIANVAYVTGGPVLGVNLFVNVNSTSSLVANRRGMVRLSNNRVIDVSVAQLIAQNYIAENNAQTYITQITVTESAYDISLFDLGEIVGFEGFGNFVDNLLLQIVGITRTPDNVTLTLGVLPPRQTALTDQLARELADAQTIDNPTTPS